ncbi:homocysteine S-methyltransferase family protein [Candidatus Pelagibacter sp.]|nr:homocysteine S-methyltransferase family protein [Candidatus Pelagibacter sp.]
MDKNFFKQVRILDGGMGQELLSRGLDPQGTLWSAKALLEQKYHSLIQDIHEDFIKAGSEVIVTNTFTTRKGRLKENNLEDKFTNLNELAGKIAQKVKKKFPNILIAGGLPPQNITYSEDNRSEKEILEDFKDQAKILNPYIDFFYFDVLSSVKEVYIAAKSIKEFNKPFLIGAHVSEGTTLPSGERLSDIIKKIECENLLGLILACVSPENFKKNINEIRSIGYPFGFKINAFEKTKISGGYTINYKKSITGNPNEFLGKRKDLTPEILHDLAKNFIDQGATIIGGCCETNPSHIKAFSKLK